MDNVSLTSLILIFIVTISYAFAYIEIMFIIYKVFSKEKFKPSMDFLCALLCIPLLLFLVSYFTSTFIPDNGGFDLFFFSLALFFASVALFALGLMVKETWQQKIQEMKIKLLSVYSLWIIQGIYLITVIVCFLLGLVALVRNILML